MRYYLALVIIIALFPVWRPAGAEDAFRLSSSVGAPSWLTLRGETRVRYETLDGQFRAGGKGSDQLLLLRTLLLAEADAGPVSFGLELQDSRTYLADAGTPISNSIANPLDILQAYAKFEFDAFLFEQSETELLLGRQTVSIGSKRQIERVSYANVIKNYTGAHLTTRFDPGHELHLLYVVPLARFPDRRTGLYDNDLSGDEEQWGRRIWGVHYRHSDILPGLTPDLWGEVFAYGLNETDKTSVQTPDRQYFGPGFRLYRKPTVSRWDGDIEAVWRTGTRRATRSPADRRDLDVEASMVFAALGYTFDLPWRPRLAAEWYWASGDDDPDDGKYGQYERLFGSRRTDLNNTSIHGPLTPANLNASGMRFEFRASDRLSGRIAYSHASLASDTDAWVIAGQRDETGQSGDFIGHAIDGRIVYDIIPDSLELEVGASVLLKGEFGRTAPRASASDETMFGYMQLSFVL